MHLRQRTAAFLTRVSADVIYGAIVLEALLGALGDPLPGSLVILTSSTLSVAVVSFAGTYAKSIGKDMESRIVTPWRDRAKMLADVTFQRIWMLAPLSVLLVFFGLAMMGTLSETGAYALTRVTLLAVLLVFGFVAARLSGAGVPRSLMSALMVTLLGYIVAQAKILATLVQGLGA